MYVDTQTVYQSLNAAHALNAAHGLPDIALGQHTAAWQKHISASGKEKYQGTIECSRDVWPVRPLSDPLAETDIVP